jgi:hypothetical protein
MRSIFLLGGFVGFGVVAIAGLMAGRAGDRVLMDAAFGCLAGALLFRFFWWSLARVLVETVRLKRVARRAAEETAAAAKAAAVVPAKQTIR